MRLFQFFRSRTRVAIHPISEFVCPEISMHPSRDHEHIAEILKNPSEKDRHVIFKDQRGEWRWRRVAPNNRTIAISGEGYTNLTFCKSMVQRMCEGANGDAVEVLTDD